MLKLQTGKNLFFAAAEFPGMIFFFLCRRLLFSGILELHMNNCKHNLKHILMPDNAHESGHYTCNNLWE